MKQAVIKLIATGIMLIAITGCTNNTPSAEAKKKLNNQTGFTLANIEVKLVKNPFFKEDEKHARYKNTTELATLLKSSLKKELESQKLSCTIKKQCVNADITVEYSRIFVLASSMLDTPKIGLNLAIKDKEKTIYAEKESNLILSRGTVNNILVQGNIGSDKIDRKQEESDFNAIAKELAIRLQRLTKES